MSFGTGTPSACERSRTVTPDWTVTGPVGGDDLARLLRLARRRAVAALARVLARAGGTAVDDDAALAAAGRRAPGAGLIGLFGLFGSDSVRHSMGSV